MRVHFVSCLSRFGVDDSLAAFDVMAAIIRISLVYRAGSEGSPKLCKFQRWPNDKTVCQCSKSQRDFSDVPGLSAQPVPYSKLLFISKSLLE